MFPASWARRHACERLGLEPDEIETTVHDVLVGRCDIGEAIRRLDEEAFDLVPSSIDLAGAEAYLLTRMGREYALQKALAGLDGSYQLILLDCPPSLGVLTITALTAADEVVIPLQCETLSHRGVGQMLSTIEDVRRLTNPGLKVAGLLPTMFDSRTNHAKEVLADVGSRYGLPVLEPPIRKSIRFAEAPRDGSSIIRFAPSHPGAQAYRALAHCIAG
jgi:chromosome partitioning protein